MNKSYHSTNEYVKYTVANSLRLNDIQKKFMEESISQRMGGMTGAPEVMQLNSNLMKSIRAKKVLDIGVYTGWSAFNAALVLPNDGKVIACDISDEMYQKVGKKYIQQAGVEHKIELRIAPAKDTLKQLIASGESGTFDFAFIDADKEGYDSYYELCLQLLRPGGIISIDNVLWSGRVLKEAKPDDSDTKALQNLVKKIHKDERVDCSFLLEGDGVMLAFKH